MWEKLKFLVSYKPFCYETNGVGTAVLKYNPFTDKVYVRRSQFGYVSGHRYITREDYLKLTPHRSETK